MNTPVPNPPVLPAVAGLPFETPTEQHVEQIRAQLRKLERRDWWLWVVAIVVMLLLTVAVVSMTFPGLIQVDDPFFQFSLNQAVRGLIGLVLIFNIYSIYQQVIVKRLRRQLSQQLDAMGDLRMRAEEFHRLATTDCLTGLANRRSGEERLAAELARSERYGHPLTLVALDLDHFKEINDLYGHAAGDVVLREFAQKLARTVRGSDLAIRSGGDEFLALLPECKIEQASSLLDRLRPIQVTFQGNSITLEFSAGSVDYQQGDTSERLLERADQLLYADKNKSKPRPERGTLTPTSA
jgi:diguanylate cyclase (GGDEF)-like protein